MLQTISQIMTPQSQASKRRHEKRFTFFSSQASRFMVKRLHCDHYQISQRKMPFVIPVAPKAILRRSHLQALPDPASNRPRHDSASTAAV